jgi:hypothetical protein
VRNQTNGQRPCYWGFVIWYWGERLATKARKGRGKNKLKYFSEIGQKSNGTGTIGRFGSIIEPLK